MLYTTKPVKSLTQNQRRQLTASITSPPMYVTILGFHIDPETDILYYDIEIGLRYGNNVRVHYVSKRFSQIKKFYNLIKKQFWLSPSVHPFPPKKFFGKREPEFIHHRQVELEKFLSSITRMHDIARNAAFTECFDINFGDFRMKAVK